MAESIFPDYLSSKEMTLRRKEWILAGYVVNGDKGRKFVWGQPRVIRRTATIHSQIAEILQALYERDERGWVLCGGQAYG